MTIIYAYIAALIATMVIISGFAVHWAASHQKRCKHATTVKLSSIQKQICADCNARLDWPLKDGQQPLVSSSRDKRSK